MTSQTKQERRKVTATLGLASKRFQHQTKRWVSYNKARNRLRRKHRQC